jgi:tetratricopeptide (TPR) repeat protein
MLNRTKRALQKRCTELALATQQLSNQGRGGEALRKYIEAVAIARRLLQEDPGDPRRLEESAGMLFSLGGLYAQQGRDEGALSSLIECEGIYRYLGDRGSLDARPQLAEVKSRKVIAEIGLAMGASAVLDADEAVSLYRELFAEDDGDEPALALAGALIYNSEALTLYGDPDLTAASADCAVRLCLPRRQAPGFTAARLHLAGAIASAYHAAAGRLDLALQGDEARVTAAWIEAAADGSAANLRSLATALAIKGLHLQATGDPGRREEAAACLAEAETLDPAEVRDAGRFWARQQAEGGDATLAQALATAARVLGPERVPDDLAAALTRPVTDGVLMIPSDRCRPQLATGYASRLAGVAIELLPVAPEEGLRVGLEAHYLFAIGSRAQTAEPGDLATWGIPWARLLSGLCRLLADRLEPRWSFSLALNLVQAHLEIIDKLLPLARRPAQPAIAAAPGERDHSLGDLLREWLALDAHLLARGNDGESAKKARKLAASIGA